MPQQQVDWVVTLDFDGDGTETFTEISRSLYDTGKQFAIVLDGQVISAPDDGRRSSPTGSAEISGDFTEQTATSLATSLKFGALPIAFEPNPPVETVGPSLAGNQLSAGLLAGGIGLLLVMVYCLLYYRGLGLVVLASLVVAAAATYALVLLLSETRRLHAVAARHRRADRRGRHHGRLVHRLLRADPRRDARRQVDAGRGRGGLGARPQHLPRRRHRVAARGGGALHLRRRAS